MQAPVRSRDYSEALRQYANDIGGPAGRTTMNTLETIERWGWSQRTVNTLIERIEPQERNWRRWADHYRNAPDKREYFVRRNHVLAAQFTLTMLHAWKRQHS